MAKDSRDHLDLFPHLANGETKTLDKCGETGLAVNRVRLAIRFSESLLVFPTLFRSETVTRAQWLQWHA